MDEYEVAQQLVAAGVPATADFGKVLIGVDTAINLLDYTLSATGTETACTIVTRLANFYSGGDGDCEFCDRMIEVGVIEHKDDCLWLLAKKWAEEWS